MSLRPRSNPPHDRARPRLDPPFRIKTASGKVMIVRRKSKARDRLEILGVIRRNVHIEPHLDAQKVVSDVVNRRFGPCYERLLLRWTEGKA
jgi:hypothetical protein